MYAARPCRRSLKFAAAALALGLLAGCSAPRTSGGIATGCRDTWKAFTPSLYGCIGHSCDQATLRDGNPNLAAHDCEVDNCNVDSSKSVTPAQMRDCTANSYNQ